MATLAIVASAAFAIPGVVGGHTASPTGPLSAGIFQPLVPSGGVAGISAGPAAGGGVGNAAAPAADPGRLEPGYVLVEPGTLSPPGTRPSVPAPLTTPGVEFVATPAPRPTPRVTPAPTPRLVATPHPTPTPAVGGISTGSGSYTLSGWASWYDNGTTAMRLPRGTRVRVCGPASCVYRIVTDYGPDASVFPNRIVDMMPTDFATVCGCSPSRGTVRVTVTVFA